MWIDTTYRSKEIEIMDDLEMGGEQLIKTLDQIANINKWLGGNGITVDGVKKLLKGHSKDNVVVIVDLGCGNGDMLRQIAAFGKRNGFNFQLLGIDANQTTIDYAIQLSRDFSNIKYIKQDVFSVDFKSIEYDIALSTLFLHHFENEVAFNLLRDLLKKARIGVVINDLHRHPIAYYAFKLLTLVINNEMAEKDGLTSILKGFKRKELASFAKKLAHKSSIHWKWAFRYQWIIQKI